MWNGDSELERIVNRALRHLANSANVRFHRGLLSSHPSLFEPYFFEGHLWESHALFSKSDIDRFLTQIYVAARDREIRRRDDYIHILHTHLKELALVRIVWHYERAQPLRQ